MKKNLILVLALTMAAGVLAVCPAAADAADGRGKTQEDIQ